MPRREPLIDTPPRPSLSFAPSASPESSAGRPDDRVALRPAGQLAPVAAHRARGTLPDEVNAFPVQAAKVQPPPLRDDILARDRLLDWLHAKIHQRLVLVLAEAGYGKTTLLADFASRTRLRTL